MRLIKINNSYVNPWQVVWMWQAREEEPNPMGVDSETMTVNVTYLYMSDGSMFRFVGTVEQLLEVINDA